MFNIFHSNQFGSVGRIRTPKESIEHIAGTDQEKRRWTKTIQTTSTIRRWRSLKLVSNLLEEKTRIRSVEIDRININWNTWSAAKSQDLERLSYFVEVSRSILNMKFLGLTRRFQKTFRFKILKRGYVTQESYTFIEWVTKKHYDRKFNKSSYIVHLFF